MEQNAQQLTKDPFAALRITEFRNLMIGRFLFIMGLRMMGTLVGWWIYELTNEPFAIGLIGLAEVIPAVSLALYAGHVIDKSEKRKIILRGVSLYFICAICLLLLSSAYGKAHLGNLQIALVISFVPVSSVLLQDLDLVLWWVKLFLKIYYKMPLLGVKGCG
jgi:MFS family permease